MGGSLALVRVAGFTWNGWQPSAVYALGGFIESLAKGIRERSTDFRFKDFAELFLPLPDLVTQDLVVRKIEDGLAVIDEGIGHLQLQIAKFKEYKTSLINSAVTGKIKITPEMVKV